MYCMKALGVVHFKGNWTNKGKQKQTQKQQKEKPSTHCLYRALPLSGLLEHSSSRPSVISDEQPSLKAGSDIQCVCLCASVCACGSEGWTKNFFCCLVDISFNALWLRWGHVAQPKNCIAPKDPRMIAPLDWRYTPALSLLLRLKHCVHPLKENRDDRGGQNFIHSQSHE